MMRRFIYKIIYLCIFLGMQFPLHAQNSVQVRSDATEYLIGDYIRITLEANGGPGVALTLPLIDSLAPGFELISAGPADTLRNDSTNRLRQEIIYSLYDSGNYTVRSVPFVFTSPKGRSDTVYSDSILLRINTLPVDTTAAIRPIKGNIEVSYRDLTWLYYAGAALMLLIAGWFAWKKWKQRKQQIALQPVFTQTTLSAHFLALLTQLESKKYWQQDEIKLYYTELTDILRQYIEQRYQVPAMESTSDEIIQMLSVKNQQGNAYLNAIFMLADMAKFAKSRPLPAQNIEAMQLAIKYIETSTPAEDPIIEIEVK
jgi:hypothetical protein